MRSKHLLTAALALGSMPLLAGAQVRVESRSPSMVWRSDDQPRAVIGISTSGSASARDTLGILINGITPKGPAEKAGLEEGNRIAAINGVSLRLASGDVDDWEMQGIMQRRLVRELEKVKPGDEVELRVYAGGQAKTVRVKTVDAESLRPERVSVRTVRDRMDDRPTLGIGIGSTGTRRDTLGVFVMTVIDSGPAARAGIEEGARIASVNGVDVRVSRADAGDGDVANAKARRLERELSNLKPGDDVELRVWQNGQYRTIKTKVGRNADLPRRRRSSFMYMGPGDMGFGPTPPMPPMPPMEIDLAPMRRSLERALEGVRRGFYDIDRSLVIPRVRVFDDEDDDAPAAAPAPRAPAATPAPSRRSGRSAMLAPVAPEMAIAASGPADVIAMSQAIARTPMADMDDGTMTVDGLRLAPVNSDLVSYLGRGSERGMLVVSAPAWARGVLAGDVILAVNGRPVRQPDGFSVSIDRSSPTRFDLLRDGKKVGVTVEAR